MYGPSRCLRLPLLLLALLAASCAPGRTTPPAGETLVLPRVAPAPIVSGADQLVPLTDGASAFAAISETLAQAQHSVDLELYEFQRRDLAALLLDARDRGVTVTAIKDPSEQSSRPIWAQLEQGGVRVVAFPVERLTIDHLKLLIVDGVRAIVGGITGACIPRVTTTSTCSRPVRWWTTSSAYSSRTSPWPVHRPSFPSPPKTAPSRC